MAEKQSRKEYQQTYYELNKDELSEKKKNRYKNDPEYRESIRKSTKKHRLKAREERERLIAEGKIHKRKPVENKPIYVFCNGEEKRAYRAKKLAENIGKSIHTLNFWSRSGIFPDTPYRTKRGDRLYTGAMIFVVRIAVRKRIDISYKDMSFYNEIVDGWKEFGVDFGLTRRNQ